MIRIPNTLLISAIGIIDDVRRCVTMDFKQTGSVICHVASADAPQLHRQMAAAIRAGLVLSCHDVSEGGMAVSVAEMAIASNIGALLQVGAVDLFREDMGGYVLEVESESQLRQIESAMPIGKFERLGVTRVEEELTIERGGQTSTMTISELRRAWRGTLDW